MNRIQRHKKYFDDAQENWRKVEEYLKMIFIDRTPLDRKNMMEFHQLVYFHCSCFSQDSTVKSQTQGRGFYEAIVYFLNIRLREIANELELITDNVELLTTYVKLWEMYRKSSEILNFGCHHLNQNWAKVENSRNKHYYVFHIYRRAIIQWKDNVFRPVDTALVNAITILLRRTDQQERIYLVLQSIVELYANAEQQTVSVPDKLNNVFDQSVVDFYKKMTLTKFQNILDSNVFTEFKHFLKYACLAMPEIENGNQFKDILKSHITPKLNEAVRRSSRCKDSKINAILAVRNSPLGRSIENHKELMDIMNKCVSVILAKYSDELMKNREMREADLKNECRHIAKIVKSVNEINLFMRRYRDYLKSRLIEETCVSYESESMMVSWLTHIFGDDTIILRVLLRVFKTSHLFNGQLQTYLRTRNLGFELNLNYFKQDRREFVEKCNLILPWEMQQAVEELKQYQFFRHPKKMLQFDFFSSFGIITINLGQTSYDLSVSTFQMAILMQFNTFQKLTFEHLIGNLNITMDILEWALNPLISNSVLIHSRTSSKLTDVVELNENLNSRKRHINFKSKLSKARKMQVKEF